MALYASNLIPLGRSLMPFCSNVFVINLINFASSILPRSSSSTPSYFVLGSSRVFFTTLINPSGFRVIVNVLDVGLYSK